MAITKLPFVGNPVPNDCPDATARYLEDQFRRLTPLVNGAIQADGLTVGFYGTTPIVQQTGVPVSAAGIHAALVNLGLIT